MYKFRGYGVCNFAEKLSDYPQQITILVGILRDMNVYQMCATWFYKSEEMVELF